MWGIGGDSSRTKNSSPSESLSPLQGRRSEFEKPKLRTDLTAADNNTAAEIIAKSESMLDKKFAPANSSKSNSAYLHANALNFDVLLLLKEVENGKLMKLEKKRREAEERQ